MASKNVITPNIGRRIERIRELKGIKQETLASSLGVSQQTISRIEKSKTIEDEKLNEIAKALDVSTEAIKNFDIDSAINLFNSIHSNHFDGESVAIYQEFNPIEKIIELYERLLQTEKEKNVLQDELLKGKSQAPKQSK